MYDEEDGISLQDKDYMKFIKVGDIVRVEWDDGIIYLQITHINNTDIFPFVGYVLHGIGHYENYEFDNKYNNDKVDIGWRFRRAESVRVVKEDEMIKNVIIDKL